VRLQQRIIFTFFAITFFLNYFHIILGYGTLFSRGDDYYNTVTINFNFSYFGTYLSYLSINTNGYVHFSYYETSDFWISIQDYDLTTLSSGGGIYYQNLNSQSLDSDSIASDLHRLNSNFQPTNLFRITYYNVPSKFGDYVVTAQIVLASDSTKSYVLLKYASCIPDAVLRKASGLYHFSSLNGQHVSNEISNACTSSNVNLDGTWVFDVTISFSINSNFSSELLKYMLAKHLNFRAVIQFGYGLSEKRLEKSIFERKAFSRT
jgi:hypothetical protein